MIAPKMLVVMPAYYVEDHYGVKPDNRAGASGHPHRLLAPKSEIRTKLEVGGLAPGRSGG